MPRQRPAISQAAENIADLLTCPVCMEAFDDREHQPKLLPCHHSFCKLCLLRLVKGNNNTVDCPTCRQRIALPPDGIAALQTNFYVAHMRDLIGESGKVKTKNCRKHGNQELSHFCNTCEVAICPDCCQKEHKDETGHNTQLMGLALQNQSKLLKVEIAEAQSSIAANQVLEQQLIAELGNLYAAKDRAVRDVDNTFDMYMEALNVRRKHLKDNVNEIYCSKRQNILSQKEELNKEDTSLSALVEQCEDAIHSGSIGDILAYKAKMAGKNSQVRHRGPLQDTGQNYIRFNEEENKAQVMNHIPEIGSLQVKGPLPSVVKFNNCQRFIAGLFTNMSLSIKSCKNEDLGNYPISVEIQDIYDDNIPCLVKHTGNGRYEVTFRPQISGLHRVKVKFLDHIIHGGELSLNVQSNNPVAKIGKQGNGPGETEYPRAVAVDAKNNSYVVDTGNNRILKFDKLNVLVDTIMLSSEGDSISSCGIAMDYNNDTFLCPEVSIQDADLAQAHSMLIYSTDGKICNRLVFQNTLRRALSVAVNSIGHIIIADFELDAIFLFDRRGRLVRRFGESGTGTGQFNHPTFVCVDDDDNIIVSDGDNHRIQVFDRSGKFQYEFGGRGTGKGKFNMPFGVGADQHGNILVVDGGNKRIQVFKGGEFVACIESLGDRLNAPRGIAVSSDGHILVADRDNHCIKKYRYLLCTSL